MTSSILKLFTKEHYQQQPAQSDEHSKRIDGSDCFECTATSAVFLVGMGTALATGLVFRTKDNKPLPNASPRYIATMRGIGGVLIPIGIFRAWQAWQVYKSDKQLE